MGKDILAGQIPQFIVPKETIFGASVFENQGFSLVSCSVSPSFEFDDFELLSKETLMKTFKDYESIIDLLTT